jgi:hypothetical protein
MLQYTAIYFEAVKKLNDSGFWLAKPQDICCIDFVSDSLRLKRVRTYNGVNTKQRKLAATKYKYTSTIWICVWRDGKNRTPALLFTFNPAFAEDAPEAEDVAKWCSKNGIDRSRIYYIKSSKYYCAEHKDQVSTAMHCYADQLAQAHVLHDGGNVFKKKKQLIVGEWAERVEVMPSAPHGEMSIVDHSCNAISKNNWDQARLPTDDEWVVVLKLLLEYDRIDPAAIQRMWVRNFLLDKDKLTLANVEDMLRGNKNVTTKRDCLMDAYKAAYHTFKEEREAQGIKEFKRDEGDELDGSYWANNERNFHCKIFIGANVNT